MSNLVGQDIRHLGTKKELYAGNVAAKTIIGFRLLNNISVKPAKQELLYEVGQ